MIQRNGNYERKSESELLEWMGGWKRETVMYLAGEQELRRRSEAKTARQNWIAIFIAILSFIIAVIALMK